MALKRTFLIGLAALLVSAPAADARSAFHRIGDGPVWSDGKRYAVVGGVAYSGKPALVIDDATGRRWTLQPPRNECGLVAAAAGQAPWGCYGLQDTPLLQTLDSGALAPVPGWDAYIDWFGEVPRCMGPERPSITGFGTRWLRATLWCYHSAPRFHYVDWHIGVFRTDVPDVARRSADLDAADLERPICAPLSRRREPDTGYGGPLFASEDYEPPWMLRDTTASPSALRLYHCGRRKPITVARCRLGDCLSPQLGGGYLTWRDGYRAYAYRLASRRRLRVGTLPGTVSEPAVVHTRRAVYAASADGKAYRAPIPRR